MTKDMSNDDGVKKITSCYISDKNTVNPFCRSEVKAQSLVLNDQFACNQNLTNGRESWWFFSRLLTNSLKIWIILRPWHQFHFQALVSWNCKGPNLATCTTKARRSQLDSRGQQPSTSKGEAQAGIFLSDFYHSTCYLKFTSKFLHAFFSTHQPPLTIMTRRASILG